MKKYIKYTESNGKEVNKEYSDEEVVRVLQQQQEIQNKSHTQMAVMFGLDFDRRNVDVLKIVLFNDKPTDKNTFTVYIADADILTDKAEWSAFSGHIEGLLINTFPEKHLYPLKERWHIMIQKLFFDFYDDDPGQGSSLSPDVDIDYRKEKLMSAIPSPARLAVYTAALLHPSGQEIQILTMQHHLRTPQMLLRFSPHCFGGIFSHLTNLPGCTAPVQRSLCSENPASF